MKTIVIHIGAPKTATSTLQVFLRKNEHLFKARGICFPQTGRGGSFSSTPLAYHLLAWSVTSSDHQPPDKLVPERHAVWHALRHEVDSSPLDHFLVTSEAFFSPLIDVKFIADVLRQYRVKVVVYLRRQNDWLEANYGTNIMMPYESPEDIEQFARLSHDSLCYHDVLNRWGHALGQENVVVRPFERHQLKDGNIIDDFLITTGLGTKSGTRPLARNYGMRLSRDSLMFLKELKKWTDDSTRFIDILRVLARAEYRYHANTVLMPFLSPQKQLALLDQYCHQNCEVAREYLEREGGILFEEPIDLTQAWVPPDDNISRVLTKGLALLFDELNRKNRSEESIV